MSNDKPCKWFAVVVPLTDRFYELNYEYGTDPQGKIRHVDFNYFDTPYANTFRAGAALRNLAEQRASEVDGVMIEVHGKYMFNTPDLVAAMAASNGDTVAK